MTKLATVMTCALLVAAAVPPAHGNGGPDPFATETLLADIGAYVVHGPAGHLTGTKADRDTQDWIAQDLRAAELEPHSDAFTHYGFRVRHAELQIGADRFEVRPMFFSGRTIKHGVTAPLTHAGGGSAAEINRADVGGKIAVVELTYVKNSVERTFDTAFEALSDAGAVGLVAVTNGPEDYPVNRNVDSRTGLHVLPTLFAGRRSGAKITAAAQAGIRGRLVLDANAAPACATNTYAFLPGATDRMIIVGTPVSSWDASASERGPGVAIMLALARHYASLTQAQRPATLVFVFTSGHELGFLGLPTFIRSHPDWFATADAYVHLGASLAARDYTVDSKGDTAPLDSGEPTRALYISENPVLQNIAADAFERTQPLGNTPPRTLNPGEQAYAYAVGVPMLSSSGAGTYFHTDGDLLPAVQPELLTNMALAYRDAIDRIASSEPQAIRNANGVASAGTSAPSPKPTNGSNVLEPAPAPSCARSSPKSCPAIRRVRVRLPSDSRFAGVAGVDGRLLSAKAAGGVVKVAVDVRSIRGRTFAMRIRVRHDGGRTRVLTRRFLVCPRHKSK